MIHTGLIKINGIREQITHDLEDLEKLRSGIHEKQRAKLEHKIDQRKHWIKELNSIELELREEL